jgi:hypothetical protein
LRLGVGLPKQLNGIIIVRAPGSTSSAAPVSTGVRPCGLNFLPYFSVRDMELFYT